MTKAVKCPVIEIVLRVSCSFDPHSDPSGASAAATTFCCSALYTSDHWTVVGRAPMALNVSIHTYWGLSSHDVVTAWLALTPSTRQSGCMQVVPGTHHEQVRHEDKFDETNMLSRGQEIAVTVDPATVIDVELAPGEMSLHHVLLFHGSERNRAEHPRIGFAIRYVATHVRQRSPIRESATLVRGTDTYGHFEPESPPEADMHPDAVARHGAIIDRQLRILYEGAQQRGKLGPAEAERRSGTLM